VDNCYFRGPSSNGAFAFEESSSMARAYFANNMMDGVMPKDPWSLARPHKGHLPGGLPANYQSKTPFDIPAIKPDPAPSACQKVIQSVGASLKRDAVDIRLLSDFEKRQGKLIDSQNEVGGWPLLKSLPAALDSDGDGMPDDWEVAHGLNPKDPSDGNKADSKTGYTYLEIYLQDIVNKGLK
jgi:hypothetical protein